MKFEETYVCLAAEHAQQIEAIRHRCGHVSSAHAFNTLYIWRRFVGDRLYLEPDMYTLQYKAKGENTWLFPCGDREAAFRFISNHIEEPDFSLCYLLEQDVSWLEQHFPGRFNIELTEGDCEYVINRAAHLALPGKCYQKLRNKVKHAEQDRCIETELLSQHNVQEALQVIHAWRGSRSAGGELNLYGDEEDAEPLTYMEKLSITGILMRVDGQPFGVAAGFMISDDTFDLFLAKESTRDPYLGYYMRRELMRLLPDSVTWVDLEDDLEIEGLRTMKKQMIPEKMINMWMAKK